MAANHGKEMPADSSLHRKDETSSVSGIGVENSTVQRDDHTFPDGGLKAWLTVLGGVPVLFACGPMNAFGVFETYYTKHQLSHVSPATISWIASLQYWTYNFSGFVWGRIFDAYGPRATLIAGSILLVLSTMATSVCTKFYQFLLLQGFLAGLAYGMLFYPIMASISTHFKKRRAAAVGIVSTSLFAGGLVFPIAARDLFARIDFGWTLRALAFLQLVLCVVGNMTVTSCITPRARAEAPRAISPLPTMTKSLRDLPFMLLVAGCFFIDLAENMPWIYLPNYAVSRGIPPSTAFYIVSAISAGTIVGQVVWAVVADVVGRFNVIAPGAFLAGILVFAFWTFADSFVTVVVFAAMYGFLGGSYFALRIPCITQIADIKEVGTRIGITYSIISFASLASGPVAGAVLKADDGRYTGMIVLCGGLQIFGSLLILFSKFRVNCNIFALV